MESKEFIITSHYEVSILASKYGFLWFKTISHLTFYKGCVFIELESKLTTNPAAYKVFLPPGMDSLEEALIGLCFKGVTDRG
jgi:hypothetical protein